ncbi:hypothetical protein S40288_10780 [Stachybotrys chartarum IBT 40288]|nr:hypothetical protein S40288_10780 [Stachybotrys chartarum IBT 40288]
MAWVIQVAIALAVVSFILKLCPPARRTANISPDEHGTASDGALEIATRKLQHDKSIADFSFFGAHTSSERLKLRAKPNERLIWVFEINNSFTTEDVATHRLFLHDAAESIKLLNKDPEAWKRIGRVAEEYMSQFASRADYLHGPIDLAPMVRVMSLGAVLAALFPLHARPLKVEVARMATDAINKLWTLSKTKKTISETPWASDELKTLKAALQALLPGNNSGPSTVLGEIMPAYETLWRVVLLAFVHVTFRSQHTETSNYLAHLTDMVDNSGIGKDSDSETKALLLCKEALRLYPPTRRIYRGDGDSVHAADVEAAHHDPVIWGPDALEFRPQRFLREPYLSTAREAYMPFGFGRNTCPASNKFAERMMAVLIGVLAKRFGPDHNGSARADIVFGVDELDCNSNTPLPIGRTAMEAWRITPRKVPMY